MFRPDGLTKNSVGDRDDPYVRDECIEPRLDRPPDRVTKNSATETILTLETSVWKLGLIIQTA